MCNHAINSTAAILRLDFENMRRPANDCLIHTCPPPGDIAVFGNSVRGLSGFNREVRHLIAEAREGEYEREGDAGFLRPNSGLYASSRYPRLRTVGTRKSIGQSAEDQGNESGKAKGKA